MCKENIDAISGRVLVQTSPSQAYNTQATIEHAKLYDDEFQNRGINRKRFCIKIPATGPGVLAMQYLTQLGIPVLGTAIFSVEQAIACSQAGCIYVSPYYNGLFSVMMTAVADAEYASRSSFAPRTVVVAECGRPGGRAPFLASDLPDHQRVSNPREENRETAAARQACRISSARLS
jgi:transaldolase